MFLHRIEVILFLMLLHYVVRTNSLQLNKENCPDRLNVQYELRIHSKFMFNVHSCDFEWQYFRRLYFHSFVSEISLKQKCRVK